MPLPIRIWISLTVALASAASCANAGVAPSTARAAAPANERRNLENPPDRVMAAASSWSGTGAVSRRTGRGAEGDTRRHALRPARVGLAADDGDDHGVQRWIAARLHHARAAGV